METVRQLLSGQHKYSSRLAAAQRPIVVLGAAALAGPDGAQLLALTQQLAQQLRARCASDAPEGWRVLSVLQRVASQAAALDLGYKPGADAARTGGARALVLLGADEGAVERSQLADNAAIIYIGEWRSSGGRKVGMVAGVS